MKIKELIKVLEAQDPETEVVVFDSYEEGWVIYEKPSPLAGKFTGQKYIPDGTYYPIN